MAINLATVDREFLVRRTLLQGITSVGKTFGLWRHVRQRLLAGEEVEVIDIHERSGAQELRVLLDFLREQGNDVLESCAERLTYKTPRDFSELKDVVADVNWKIKSIEKGTANLDIVRAPRLIGLDAIHYLVELSRTHVRNRYIKKGMYKNHKGAWVPIPDNDLFELEGYLYQSCTREVTELLQMIMDTGADLVVTMDHTHPKVDDYLPVAKKFDYVVRLGKTFTAGAVSWTYEIQKLRGEPLESSEYATMPLPPWKTGVHIMDILDGKIRKGRSEVV